MRNNLAAEIFHRASLRLCWSDADPRSRGAVLDPAEMVGWQVRYLAPVLSREENGEFGHATSPGADISSLEYQCIGHAHGEQLGDFDALWLVQALLGMRETWPAWARPVEQGVEFLLLDEDGFCLRHHDEAHRHGWVCRVWVEALDGAAVDLTRIDWRAMEALRAELEAQIADDERRALAARAEMRERAAVWRRADAERKRAERLATLNSSPETIDGDRKPSHGGGIVSHDGSTVALETYGAATPMKLGESPSEPPPDLLPQAGEAFAVSGDK